MSGCVEIVYELPLLQNNGACNIFTQIGSGATCCLDIYRWDHKLAVTGRIRDVEHNILKSSF